MAAIQLLNSRKSILSKVSAFVWWYQKYLELSTLRDITGTPLSFNGATSAALPQLVMVPAPIGSSNDAISRM